MKCAPVTDVHLDFSQAWITVQRLIDGSIAMLPRFALGLVVFGIFVLIGKGARAIIRWHARREHAHANLEQALGRLAQAGIVILGLLLAVTLTFPTFSPGDLIGLLGISSIAVGFAFKDIFQNFLAGILILLTRPFEVGDEILFQSYEGTVEDIQTRATFMKTYDGRRVVIPNSELYTNAVTVNTAFPRRRTQFDVGIGYGDDIGRAGQLMLEAMKGVQGVLSDPAPDVLVVALADSSVNLRARWWSESRRLETLQVQDRVLAAIKATLSANGIDLPYPTRTVLLHDQTEDTDGNRREQREGWPAGKGSVPKPRSIADAIRQAAGSQAPGQSGDGAHRARTPSG